MRIGGHDQVEAGADGLLDPGIVRALIEYEAHRHVGLLGRRLAEGGIEAQLLSRRVLALGEPFAVEADDDGRARGLGRIDHALDRLEAPALEIAERVVVVAGLLHQAIDRFERHGNKTPDRAQRP